MKYLKDRTTEYILTGDIKSFFNTHSEIKYLFETYDSLISHMKDRGFIFVDTPEKADAIMAFRIQLTGYDVYHECARNASIRIIDVNSRDTLMVVYTTGMNFFSVKRDIHDEMKELFKLIDKNIDMPYSALIFENNLDEAKEPKYENVEAEGISVKAGSLYRGGLSKRYFGMSFKDHHILPARVVIKNNSNEDIVLSSSKCRFYADNAISQNAMISYEVMKIIGKYDAIFEAVLGSVLGGYGGFKLADTEGWAPENDKKEFSVVYGKFDPIVKIRPGEEAKGALLFSVLSTKKNPVDFNGGTLELAIKKASGDDVKITIPIKDEI